jgi:molybdate transport system regulatory protein
MTTLRLRSRQWIVNEEGEIIMGEGRKKILETIEKTGSINQTAKMMKMSYKGVWSKIKATEKYLGSKLVEADKRRGSYLTENGRALLEKYTLLKKRCVREDDRIFQKIFDLGDP